MYPDDDKVSNDSDNPTFETVLETYISRRKVLAGGLALAAAGFFGSTAAAATGSSTRKTPAAGRLMNFRPLPLPSLDDDGKWPRISDDYRYQVLLPWGDPLQPGGPSYQGDPDTRPTAEQQEKMCGIGHDGMTFFPIGELPGPGDTSNDGNSHGVLCINYEFGRNTHVLGHESPRSVDDVRLSQHAHGVGVIEIQRLNGRWQQVQSDHARRIHVNTPVTFSGPVAGHALLSNPGNNPALGTVNNCSNGQTLWGTYLTCEENFNKYFGATKTAADGKRINDAAWRPNPAQQRYGFDHDGGGYGWELFDPRFDLADPVYANECNRFGWVVEIDPFNAGKPPVKRTALGRCKHEGATMVEGKDRRCVVYMGDDQRFDYIYRYVSAGDWQAMRENGTSPLDEGRLYVARFNDDGTGEWLELTIDNPALRAKFADQAEVLTYARLAADALGATPMDRPEWTAVDRETGWVYCTLTNNSKRTTPSGPNPMAPNADGHIIRWRDSDQHTGLTFRWEIFLIAKDTHGTEDSYSDPDGIAIDPDGRLFIETDGGQQTENGVQLQNQLLVADTRSGSKEIRRLFAGVNGCEVTGLTMTPDRRTLFCNIQHPGNGDPQATNFPANTDGKTLPRDCTIVITRKDGGIVGS